MMDEGRSWAWTLPWRQQSAGHIYVVVVFADFTFLSLRVMHIFDDRLHIHFFLNEESLWPLHLDDACNYFINYL